jgi:hypothetical protein
LILVAGFAVLVYGVYIILPIIIATIRHGFGGRFDLTFILSILKPFLAQLLMVLAVTSIGMFLVFTTKRTAAVNGFYLAFLMVPLILIIMLSAINESFLDLMDYELTMNMRSLANFSALSTGDICKSIFIGIGYILVSTIVGVTLFRRCEVK